MEDERNIVIIRGESIELHKDEMITDETMQELTNGKGGDE